VVSANNINYHELFLAMALVSDILTKNYLKLSSTDSLSTAIAKMKKKKERIALVFERNKLKGIFDERSLITSKIDPIKSKVGKFTKKPPTISLDQTLIDAAELMYHSYPCVLVVKKSGAIKGIVRAKDIISQIKNISELARRKVAEVMTTDVITFNYESRLGDVLNKLREKGIGRAPIVDKKGNLISIFTVADIIEKVLIRPKRKIKGYRDAKAKIKGSKGWTPKDIFLLDANVGDEATHSVVSVTPKTRLDVAVNKMLENNISDVVVTENKKPVGIITTRDLLKLFLELKTPEYWPIQFYGLNHVKPFQEHLVRQKVQELFEKIRRAYFKNVIYFMVHIKPYEEGFAGKAKKRGRTKWSIKLRLATPSKVFTAEQAHFHLDTAISWAIKEMEKILQEYKTKLREKSQKQKKGRRAMFEKFIRRKRDILGGLSPYSSLVKR